ncbi:MAG: substrate-specific activator of APC-dependent proteolysis [Piccolia ochrophora]|nr:MAG: substrate-specific activator of APC-dependent proteolysis [Piccolia ochrophora]
MRSTEVVTNFMASSTFEAADALSERPQTPPLVSPPESSTPPVQLGAGGIRNQGTSQRVNGVESGVDAVDPNALSRALKDFEEGGRQLDRTPGGSPSRKRQRVYGDSLLHDDGSPATPSKAKRRTPHGELHFQKSEIYCTLEHRLCSQKKPLTQVTI